MSREYEKYAKGGESDMEDRDRINSLAIYIILKLININYICNDLHKN